MRAPASRKMVCVTGATKGIGLDIARHLCTIGYHVLGVARGTSDDYTRLSTDHPGKVQLIEADLGTDSGLRAVAAQLSRCSTLYSLVNNAGQATTGLHLTVPRRELDAVMALNLAAPMMLSQAALRPMITQRTGRIITISSVCAQRPYRGLGVYSATKAGVEGFTRVLAAEIGQWGITANCIAPGYVETAMTTVLDATTTARIRRRSMLPHTTTGADVGQTVAFLLSPAAAAITAEVIRVDGGSAA